MSVLSLLITRVHATHSIKPKGHPFIWNKDQPTLIQSKSNKCNPIKSGRNNSILEQLYSAQMVTRLINGKRWELRWVKTMRNMLKEVQPFFLLKTCESLLKSILQQEEIVQQLKTKKSQQKEKVINSKTK